MHLLVTAGPTREYLDSVRFISNASTGKMGFEIAAEAASRGHRVSLIRGPVELLDPPGVHAVRVTSAAEMLGKAVSIFIECDAAIMAAAVCDFRPKQCLDKKAAKSQQAFFLELEPTVDICAHLGRIKEGRIVVGFAMEDHDHRAHAEAKLCAKGCDALILNDVRNMGSDQAQAEILRADTGWQQPFSGTKPQAAEIIMDLVEDLVHSSKC